MKAWLLRARWLGAGSVLVLGLLLSGCASSGTVAAGTSTRIGGYVDTSAQRNF